MTTVVLDTGALIALERADRGLWAVLRLVDKSLDAVQVPVGVIAQAWRDGSRQVLLARALKLCDEVPMDGPSAREAGVLCGMTGTSDVIDASVVVAAARAARFGAVDLITSDRDMRQLLAIQGSSIQVIDV